jgi:hypothetical protein
MRKRKEPHVVLQNGHPRCLNCGASYIVNLPAPVDIVVAIWRAFDKLHRLCPKKGEKFEASRAYYKKRREKGICTRCPQKAEPDRSRCKDCRKAAAAYIKKRRDDEASNENA